MIPSQARHLISTLDMRDRASEEIGYSKKSMRNVLQSLANMHESLLHSYLSVGSSSLFHAGKRLLIGKRMDFVRKRIEECQSQFSPYISVGDYPSLTHNRPLAASFDMFAVTVLLDISAPDDLESHVTKTVPMLFEDIDSDSDMLEDSESEESDA